MTRIIQPLKCHRKATQATTQQKWTDMNSNKIKMRLGMLCIALVCLIGVTAGTDARFRDWRQKGPRVVLWAWERPEDLLFIDPETTGVAFLAGTIRIKDNGTVMIDARRQPLRVPEHASLIAVVRIEPDRASRPALSPGVRSDVAGAVTQLAAAFSATQVQIDFDALASERDFYRGLLNDVRKRLPADVPLSMTALASWCIHDTWMSGLPVDEAVPMLFRMGAEGPRIVREVGKNGDFREPLCRASIGVSTDEPFAGILPGKRVYIFSPTSWSKPQADAVVREVRRWQ